MSKGKDKIAAKRLRDARAMFAAQHAPPKKFTGGRLPAKSSPTKKSAGSTGRRGG